MSRTNLLISMLTDFECVENLIAWAIEFVYDGWIGKGTDERLDKYLIKS
ncbi:MAG: hypothetical protein K6B69_09915 [Lachnospiraceae bacterium]|nr:hypothetical protein [Lachnospiraceae bacterium]